MSHDTNDVVSRLSAELQNAEIEESDLAGGVRAVIPDDEIGRFFGLVRREGFDAETKRDPSGENLVANISAEKESKGLGDIFA